MREFEVVVSDIAKERLHDCLDYIKYVLGNDQAAESVYYDYVATRQNLERVAGSIRLCEDEELAALGYHRFNFLEHNYFLLYRVVGNIAYVDYIFHGLEDYKNKL